jgi:hypothetical protein
MYNMSYNKPFSEISVWASRKVGLILDRNQICHAALKGDIQNQISSKSTK